MVLSRRAVPVLSLTPEVLQARRHAHLQGDGVTAMAGAERAKVLAFPEGDKCQQNGNILVDRRLAAAQPTLAVGDAVCCVLCEVDPPPVLDS